MRTFNTFFILCLTALSSGAQISNSNDKLLSKRYNNTQPSLKLRLGISSQRVAPEEFPYMTSIQIHNQHTCGGALLSPSHVLTACHCLLNIIEDSSYSVDVITVEVGSMTIGTGRSYGVKRIACMNSLTTKRVSDIFYPDDIGMVTLQKSIVTDDKVKIIRLPPPFFELPIGANVVVTGYGGSHVSLAPSSFMKKTELHTITEKECNNFYFNRFATRITSKHICVTRGFGHGTCTGDSGSPLMYNRQVVGIVSGGSGSCGIGDPDVFTKVSHYISFIKQEMNTHDN